MKKIIRILPIIIGSMMLLYPWIGNWLYDHAVRSQAAGYEKALIEKTETELQNCILAAQNYNEELKKRQNVMIYPPQEQSLNHEAYEAVLCMNAEGLMGFIEIPQIHIYLPIYHGTSPEETQILGAEPDRDLVTLLTCTPYGQNTHRLLVTGQRIADDAQTAVAHKADNRQRREWKSQWMTSYAKAVCFSVGILFVLYCVCRVVHIVQIRKRKNMMCGQK